MNRAASAPIRWHDGGVRILAAPDTFRGSISAPEAAAVIASVGRSLGHEVVTAPLSDGGEGFLDVFGGPNRQVTVTGPLGEPVRAGWRLSAGTAVIEMARASGLEIVGGAAGNDPIAATTAGTGELLHAALDAGARRIIVGHGGSATTDGGLAAVRSFTSTARLRGVELVAAVDVRTRFLDAAEVFAAQKGATPSQVALLTRRLERLAQVYEEEFGVDVTESEGAGAAGGLAGGLAAVGATIEMGFDVVADHLRLDELVEDADLVVTGEGFLDATSFDGKVVGGVVELAEEFGVPVLAIAGRIFDDADRRVDAVDLTRRFGASRSLGDTAACIGEVVGDRLRESIGEHSR